MPRFVILRHDHPHLHWDFMLETGEVLRAWRLEREPLADAGPIAATALADHRLMYLDYEGPVSGGRGTVTRWDAGEFLEESRGAARHGRQVRVWLLGRLASGRVVLEWHSGNDWTFAWDDADQ